MNPLHTKLFKSLYLLFYDVLIYPGALIPNSTYVKSIGVC